MKRLALLCFLLTTAAFGQPHSNTLTWQWSQGTGDPGTGFHVKKAQVSGGPYTTIATIASPTTLTYVDTAVVAGQINYYVVTAFNTGGESVPSNQVTCTTPFSPPTPPSTLSVVVQ